MKRILIAASSAAIAAGLAGCATPLPEMDSDFLCMHYGNNAQSNTDRVPSIREELERRKLLTSAEWVQVDKRRLNFGIGRCAMFAIKGSPFVVNNTHTKDVIRTQYGFADPYGRKTYVYTENQVIRSWQD